MIISNKEKALLAITIVVMLYAFIGISFRKKYDAFNTERRVQTEKEQLIASYQNLISQKTHWEDTYLTHSKKMPTFSHNKQVETYWSGILDRIASTNKVTIISRNINKEQRIGDVYEMAIECKWESNLDSLVSFLYDIHAEGAMLDIRKLTIRPNKNKSVELSGNLTIFCAYMRDESISPKEPNK